MCCSFWKIVFNSQAGVEYSIDNGTNYFATTTFTGLTPGTYFLTVRSISDNTCTTSAVTVTINPVPTAPATPTVSSVTQPTCGTPSGTIVFNSQAGVEYSVDNGSGPVSFGKYNFLWIDARYIYTNCP